MMKTPVNPMEVLLTEEETGLRLKASQDEMQLAVDAALSLNASDPLAAAQEPPLPWTDDEELMVGGHDAQSSWKASSWLRFASLALAVSSAAFGLVRMLGVAPAAAFSAKAKKGCSSSNMLLSGVRRPEIYSV